MTFSSLIAWLPLLLGLSAEQDGGQQAVRSVVIQEELIVRVPVRPVAPARVVWVPGREYKCIPVSAIRGATLSGSQRLDLVLRDRRVRARLSDDCPALDFYGGFYLKPSGGRLCAGRDIVYSRMGGSCPILGLQHLVPRVRISSVP